MAGGRQGALGDASQAREPGAGAQAGNEHPQHRNRRPRRGGGLAGGGKEEGTLADASVP